MRQSYIVDASVGVQWLHSYHETAIDQSLLLLQGAVGNAYNLVVPDLFWYEVSNALIRGKGLKGKVLEHTLDLFFSLPLNYVWATQKRIAFASLLASRYALSVYDAIYAALSIEYDALLITANMKHQGRVKGLNIIDIKEWRG